MTEPLTDDHWWGDLMTCFHRVPFRYACAGCGRKDDPEPVLRATIDTLTEQLAEMTRERDEAIDLLHVNQDAHKRCDVLMAELGRKLTAAEQRVKELQDVVDAACAELRALIGTEPGKGT